MATALTRRDPMRATRLAARAGALVRRCGRQQKHIAMAAGVTAQAVTNWRSGATYGPFYDALEAAERLGATLSTQYTDPYPALVEMEVIVMEASLSRWSDADLVREWRRMAEQESEYQAREDQATARYMIRGGTRCLRELAEAHKAEAAYQIRFAAVCEILAQRGIDPLDSEWDWVETRA